MRKLKTSMGIFDFFKKKEKLSPEKRIDKILSIKASAGDSAKNLQKKIRQLRCLANEINGLEYSSDIIRELNLTINDIDKFIDAKAFSNERIGKEIDDVVMMLRNRFEI